MRTILIGLLSAILVGCSVKLPVVFYTPARSEVARGVVRLVSFHNRGHGCPIDSHLLLTARHVATSAQGGPLVALWSDGGGRHGSVWGLRYDPRRDIALMQSDHAFTARYQLADEAPAIGSFVTLPGTDDGRRPSMPTFVAQVVNIVAEHLFFEVPNENLAGRSGSCVLDEHSRLVGIFQWVVDDRRGGRLGVASATWGEWSDVTWSRPL